MRTITHATRQISNTKEFWFTIGTKLYHDINDERMRILVRLVLLKWKVFRKNLEICYPPICNRCMRTVRHATPQTSSTTEFCPWDLRLVPSHTMVLMINPMRILVCLVLNYLLSTIRHARRQTSNNSPNSTQSKRQDHRVVVGTDCAIPVALRCSVL